MKFDGDINAPFSHLLRLAEDELLDTLTALPAEIRETLRAVPVICTSEGKNTRARETATLG